MGSLNPQFPSLPEIKVQVARNQADLQNRQFSSTPLDTVSHSPAQRLPIIRRSLQGLGRAAMKRVAAGRETIRTTLPEPLNAWKTLASSVERFPIPGCSTISQRSNGRICPSSCSR